MSTAAIRLAALGEILRHGGDAMLRDRIHPRIATHAQANARWSITDPPLQQMPIDLLDMLVPDPGTAWFGWDWDQQELRIIAALSKDAALLDWFEKGYDVHTLTACDLFGLPAPPDPRDPHGAAVAAPWRGDVKWEGKDDPRRTFAKRFVYRLNYGGDPKRAGSIPGAKALGLTGVSLRRASQRFLVAHPGLAAWRRRTDATVQATRCVRTFMGRKRVLTARPSEITRQAFDFPMQAGAADMMNETVLTVERTWQGRITLKYQRHDFLQWAVPLDLWLDSTLTKLADIAERVWRLEGTPLAIPATFYVRRRAGEKLHWTRGMPLPELETYANN